MKFIAQVDINVLGIKKGQIFEINSENLNDPSGKIFKDPSLFKEYVEPEMCLHENDKVVIWGYWENLTHPSKTFMRPCRVDQITARLTVVCEKTPGCYMITAMANDGTRYQITSDNIKKAEFEKGVPTSKGGYMCHISYKHLYWFVNSDGVICSDIIGRNKVRENWLKKSGNYWLDHSLANQYRDHILYGKPFEYDGKSQ